MPSDRGMRARQPMALSRSTFISLRGVPSGLVGSVTISPVKLTASATIPANSRIELKYPTNVM